MHAYLKDKPPFSRGRRTGPDATISRDENWAAIAREANPPRQTWFLSTLNFFANNAVSITGTFDTLLRLVPLMPISGILDAVAARIKIYTAHATTPIQTLRVCIYRYDVQRNPALRAFHKVRNSEAIFDLTNPFKATPYDIPLANNGVTTILPDRQYFLGFRSSSTTLKMAGVTNNEVCPFASYIVESADYSGGVLPTVLDVTSLRKDYDCDVPWITYLSNDAKNLF